ncbi:MAG: phosphate ABC transporter substrate-binding protein PstS, partial [Coleofasciculus sp. C2-GNP5-27]
MFLSPTSLRRTLIPSAVTIAVVLGVLNPAIAQQLIGAGASFPDPLYQRYFTEYQAATGMEVKYSAIGSGGGIQRFINESVEFAGSDAPPTDAEKAQMNQERGLLMVPTAGGAVAVIYNLQGVTTTLRLPRDTLAKIFTGQIGNWKQVNTYLPNRDIRVVVRSDSSGTSFIFSHYLSVIT